MTIHLDHDGDACLMTWSVPNKTITSTKSYR